jgi:hypothetical protein
MGEGDRTYLDRSPPPQRERPWTSIRVSCRLLLQAGIGSVVEAFALGQQYDVLQDPTERQGSAERITVSSPAHLHGVLGHLREQWYALVKTDNVLGDWGSAASRGCASVR